mgnify:FL=1
MVKSTLVIGASLRESRFSNICVRTLAAGHFPVTALGLREGFIDNIPVQSGFPVLQGIHTITLYLGPQNQPIYYDYILSLKPERVIFNPGTENPEFQQTLAKAGIGFTEDCTIMMVEGDRF